MRRSMPEVLHIEFNTTTVAWIGDLQARTANSLSRLVRDRYQSWAAVGLGELALAIATRLAIARRVESQLRESVTRLKDELVQSNNLDEVLAEGYCYRPSDEHLPFDICAAVDACFFEWRSLYEVVGKFATTYCQEILGVTVTELQLIAVVERAGVPTRWINPLRENRKHFFHQAAPWIGLEVRARRPFECSLVIMKENLSNLDDPTKYVSEAELVEVSNGLRNAVAAVRDWLKAKLQSLENGADEGSR